MNTPNSTPLTTPPSTVDLSQQIEALRATLSKLVTTVSGDVSEGIGDAGRQIRRTSRDARASATTMVLDHPLTAVGIAVGAGLLVGMLARKS